MIPQALLDFPVFHWELFYGVTRISSLSNYSEIWTRKKLKKGIIGLFLFTVYREEWDVCLPVFLLFEFFNIKFLVSRLM